MRVGGWGRKIFTPLWLLLGEGRGIYHGDVMWCRRGFQIKFAAVICADRRRVGLIDYLLLWRLVTKVFR